MTEKLTNQQREYEAQQMHRQHLQVCNSITKSMYSIIKSMYSITKSMYSITKSMYSIIKSMYSIIKSMYSIIKRMYSIIKSMYSIIKSKRGRNLLISVLLWKPVSHQKPVCWKPRKRFGPSKPYLVNLYVKAERCIGLNNYVNKTAQ